jgi:hypothetical protein
MPGPALITLDEAKRQLNLSLESDEHDEQITSQISEASALVVDYLKYPTWLGWGVGSPLYAGSPSVEDDPRYLIVQAAVLQVTCNLFLHRGDEGAPDGPITQRVVNMLMRLRDPALA